MGSHSRFICSCGYTCEVSGGPDVGMTCKTRTVVCLSCRTVEDAVSKTMGGNRQWITVKVNCPTCGGPVKSWPRQHPCPKCGSAMMMDPNYIRLWD
jgi:endogenous inhibitor of DNA gyrase (YacG/DUF329 family)